MTANIKTREQRQHRRVSIPEQPKIYNAHSGEVIGELVNLSSDGLMAASSNCISCGSVCQMRIPLVKGEKQFDIHVGAESLWCEDANGSGTYWTGFQIIDISPDDQLVLDAIVGD